MGKVAQQVDLVRIEPANFLQGPSAFRSNGNCSTGQAIGRTFPRPHFPGISSTVISIIDNVRSDRSSFHSDQVTGLPSRVHFQSALHDMITNGVSECAVMFVDLNKFRRINKCFGHQTGDDLLHAAARRLRRFGIEHDAVVGRFGGDEFVLFVHGENDAAALNALAERLVSDFAEPHQLDSLSISVTASVGIARFPIDGTEASQLIQYAHTAMYAAKDMGGQGFRHFAPDMTTRAANSLQIEGRLRQALENNEFSLMFQPIVRPGSPDVLIVETLLRWKNDQNEIVTPDQFIPVAEESGLILDIGRWVLHAACRQASHWRQTRATPIVVSVNASPLQLANPKFCDDVQAAMEAAGLPPALLAIEMTERMMVAEDAIISANICRLTQMGVRVALDDFGTGYSSLSYLTRYQIQCIKIDRSFIDKIECDLQARALVQAIIGIGKSLNVVMVAEGVETQGQAALLESLGCDYLQGYLIGRPVVAEAL
ncbi:putative bifunctional diguanylate cyclase/phosphodiesterase [Noviherbaspirillum suwonense]|nr:bifunctional diguanylate cyclase/phosphodiesterase [Noviherbaspirillum suwonense]